MEQNRVFAKWFQDWIAVTQQNRASVERIVPEKTAREDAQEHSDGTCLLSTKRLVESGRHDA
jgi:hypothetical protein